MKKDSLFTRAARFALPLGVCLAGLLSLTACSFSLAGDVTPMPALALTEPAPATPKPAQTSLPFMAADPVNGKAIYQEKCADCHGARGMGDGAQAGKLPSPPPPLGTRAVLTAARPTDWYAIVTYGKLEKIMPGFAASLDDRQRWDVVAYLYTFGMSEDSLALGRQVYRQYCQNCHGLRGAGDGPQAASLARQPRDWTDPALLAQRSASELYQTVLTGLSPAMPAFKTELTEEQRWAVVSYLRSSWFASTKPLLAEQAEPTPDNDAVALPSPTAQPAAEAETSAQIEMTSDTSGLVAERMHLIFEFSQPNILQVTEMYLISNPQDKMIIPEAADRPLIEYGLPQGYQNLQIQDGSLGERYLLTEGGFGDLQPIPPLGAVQEIFVFEIPYNRSAKVELRMPVAVDQVIVMLPSGGVTLESARLTSAGQRSFQGANLSLFLGGGFKAGEMLSMELSGRPQAAGAALNNAENINLAVGIGVFGLVLLGVGYWLYRTQPGVAARRSVPSAPESAEELMDAILALDDLHKEGKLSSKAYRQRRAELKARLKNLGPS